MELHLRDNNYKLFHMKNVKELQCQYQFLLEENQELRAENERLHAENERLRGGSAGVSG